MYIQRNKLLITTRHSENKERLIWRNGENVVNLCFKSASKITQMPIHTDIANCICSG